MSLERRAAAVIALIFAGAGFAANAAHRYDPKAHHRFERIAAMVPMRDGAKLETVVLVPKHRAGPLPILLRRSPYGVPSPGDEPTPDGWASDLPPERYIFAYENIRGRFGSEGTFEMVRPVRDRGDAKAIDESTDAYDTIEWLVHQVPGNSGKVCTRGVSYDGWTAAMSLVDPHPALRCATEQASPSDMFLNDDFHHNGAFRLSYGFEYSADLETVKDKNTEFPFETRDTYDWYLRVGALSHADERYFHGKMPTWENFVAHPDRDEFWQRRAIGGSLTHTAVPDLNVAGWWDQEDFVGPLDIYARLEKTDAAGVNYDTWEWDGTSWTQLQVTQPDTVDGGSMGRSMHAMAQLGDEVVLFGGTANPGQFDLGDTWTWNGVAWTQLHVAGPPARNGHAMATLGSKIVMYGGCTGPLTDTWTFDGTSWTQVATTGQNPGDFRCGSAMATVGNEVVLFGGVGADASTWLYDGTSWTQSPATGPGMRSFFAMATLGGKAVLFGGEQDANTYLADTWTFDGTTWKELQIPGPAERFHHAMAPLGGVLVLFGGGGPPGGTPWYGDTWTFDGTAWTMLGATGPVGRLVYTLASR